LNEIGFGSLGGILPEIILLIGGLLILLLDMAQDDEREAGSGFMAVTVIFLIVALAGVFLQLGMAPQVALGMVDVDPFAIFLKIAIYTSMTLVAVGGGSYMNRRATSGRGEFWALFLFVTLAMSISVSANNLLLLFLGIEFLSITSYILTGFLREDRRSAEAGVKYFIYGSVASSLMLYGMSLLYGASGSLNLQTIGQALAETPDLGSIILPASLLALVGFGFKASLAPFHQWAPDIYDGAPTPITAYLSTASKTVGFAVMARVLIVALGAYRVDWVPVLAGLSILTMTVGNLMALRQTSVKRMLAYSSVAQAGYILMGLAAIVSGGAVDITVLGMNGLNGLLLYLFAYVFTNVGAFMVVLAVEEESGSHELAAFSKLGERAPGLAWAMFIFLLSLTGIPLTGGFVGKFYVFGAAVQHQYFWLAGIGLINAGIAAFYYLNIVRYMFFAPDDAYLGPARVVTPVAVQVIVLLCVGATIWIGLYPPNVIEWANDASRQLLGLML
jgi:proton-translocating NADH-quinone oxidoreductase chain N